MLRVKFDFPPTSVFVSLMAIDEILLSLVFTSLSFSLIFFTGFNFYKSLRHLIDLPIPLIGILGQAVLLVLSIYSYRLGISWGIAYFIAWIFGALGIKKFFQHLSTSSQSELTELRGYFLASLALLLFFLVPKWVGGYRLFAFHGNPYDSLNYLETAAGILHFPRRFLLGNHPELAGSDLFRNVSSLVLLERTGVMHILALLATPFKSSVYQFGADYSALSIWFLFSAIFFFLRELCEFTIKIALISAFSVSVGFWGQLTVDIDAWGQLSSAGVILGFWCTLSKTILTRKTNLPFNQILVLTVLFTGGLGLYPESFVFHLPAILVGLMILFVFHFRKSFIPHFVSWLVRVQLPVLLLSLILLAPALSSIIGVITGRFIGTIHEDVNWWMNFFGPLFGKDGPGDSHIQFAIDFILGTLGGYFFLPAAGAPRATFIVIKTVLFLILLATFYCFYLQFNEARQNQKSNFASKFLVIGGIYSVLLLQFVVLVNFANKYSAYKSFSYFAPGLVSLCLATLCNGYLTPKFSRLSSVCFHLGIVFVIANVGFGIARSVGANHWNGTLYPAPYPGGNYELAPNGSKSDFMWNIRDVAVGLERNSCRAAYIGQGTSIGDVFLDRFLKVVLMSKSVHFPDSIRPWWDPSKADCRISLKNIPTRLGGVLEVQRP